MGVFQRWRERLRTHVRALPSLAEVTGAQAPLDEATWQRVIGGIAFLSTLSAEEQARLRALSAVFLARKEFHGLLNLRITDDMAVAIAAQACLPLLHLGDPKRPEQTLRWYDGLVSVIVSPCEVPVRRQWQDDAGVMHSGIETVSGEISEDGPVLLSWPDVQAGMGQATAEWHAQRRQREQARVAEGMPLPHPDTPYNVVIHEFCHKIDMRTGEADGCPPLPAGFLGHARVADAREAWLCRLKDAFESQVEQVEAAERFGQPMPWLDAYGATDVSEFFSVACEGYFTDRARFAQVWPDLLALFDAWFRPHEARAETASASQ